MDPLTALGLVSNVVQLIDFTAKLLTETREFMSSTSDALPRNDWIESLAKQNHELAEDIDAASRVYQPQSKADLAVVKLAVRCSEESKRLITMLEPLKVKTRADGTRYKREVPGKVVRSMLRKNEIAESQDKLQRLELQLAVLLLLSIRSSHADEFQDIKKLVQSNGDGAVATVQKAKNDIVVQIKDMTEALSDKMDSLSLTTANVANMLLSAEEEKKAQKIIESLGVDGMNSRRDMIEERHRQTFEWIFLEHRTPFDQWLSNGCGIFWVCGDAASGKSVLMKFLRQHQRTIELLQSWAGACNFMILDHYFWAAGNQMQTSLQGMLQTLLGRALEADPALAKSVCQQRWLCTQVIGQRSAPWTTDELLHSLNAISAKVKLCIFVDGLDECNERSHRNLIRILHLLATQNNIKLCVSSRPWSVFDEAYSPSRNKIFLQDLTRHDMFDFVRDKLMAETNIFSDHMCMEEIHWSDHWSRHYDHEIDQRLNGAQQRDARSFLREMVDKSAGNFLWASLVLDTICTRLMHGQSLSQVASYLNELPRELEQYIEKHVYERISATYRNHQYSETAMALHIMITGSGRWNRFHPWLGYFWHLRNSSSGTNDMITDPCFGQHFAFREITKIEQGSMVVEAMNFLSGCCKGLLKVTVKVAADQPSCIHTCPWPHWGFDVTFTHRSIYDFLRTQKMKDSIKNQIPEHFNTKAFREQLFILHLKHLPEQQLFRGHSTSVIFEGHSSSMRVDHPESHFRCEHIYDQCFEFLLDPDCQHTNSALDEYLSQYRQSWCEDSRKCSVRYSTPDNDGVSHGNSILHLLSALVKRNRFTFATEALHGMPWLSGAYLTYGRIFGHTLCSTIPEEVHRRGNFVERLDLLKHLLASGADPNERLITYSLSTRTSWHEVLRDMWIVTHQNLLCNYPPDREASYQSACTEYVMAFLKHAADLSTPVCVATGDCHYYSHSILCKFPCQCRKDLCSEHFVKSRGQWIPEVSDWCRSHHADHEFRSPIEILKAVIPQQDLPEVRRLFDEFSQPVVIERVRGARLQTIQYYPDDWLSIEDLRSLGRTESAEKRENRLKESIDSLPLFKGDRLANFDQ